MTAVTSKLRSFQLFVRKVAALALPYFRSEEKWKARALLAAIVVLNLFVIPVFAKVFAGFKTELPLITRGLLGFSAWMIAWWPGRIRPAVTSEVASTLDVFPTLLALSGVTVPQGLILDGRDASSILFQTARRPDAPFLFFRGEELMAIRFNDWKLHFQTQVGYGGPPRERHDPPLLFDLGRDPGERRNVAAAFPDRVAELRSLAEATRSRVTPAPSQLR